MEAQVTREAAALRAADRIILPGVGAFGDARAKLDATGLVPCCGRRQPAKPLLGICLGMQLLFDRSSEYGDHPGLGLVPGEVTDLRADLEDPALKVPHMAGTACTCCGMTPCSATSGTGNTCTTFIASTPITARQARWRFLRTAMWPSPVCAQRQRLGTQFHPEKSGDAGLRLLKAFGEL